MSENQDPLEYTLKLTQGQMRVLTEALDLFTRIGIGQLEEVVHMFRFLNDPRIEELEKLEIGEKLLNELKKVLFNKEPGASYGIGHPEVPDCYKVARDMHCVAKYAMWLANPNRNNASTYSTLPFPFGQEPLMEIEHESKKDQH